MRSGRPGISCWRQIAASVMEVVCDPDVPIIPPHLTLDQFGKSMTSFVQGDEEAIGVLWQSARQGWPALTTR